MAYVSSLSGFPGFLREKPNGRSAARGESGERREQTNGAMFETE
jgi:hypothetical protein